MSKPYAHPQPEPDRSLASDLSNMDQRHRLSLTASQRWLNTLAIGTFVLGLICLTSPALQVLPTQGWRDWVLAPAYLVMFIHGIGILTGWIAGALLLNLQQNLADTSILATYLWLLVPFTGLSLIVSWGWTIAAIRAGSRQAMGRSNRGDRLLWLIPILGWVLSLVWASQWPLKASFALHRPAFEQFVTQVNLQPHPEWQLGMQEFNPPRWIGAYPVAAVVRASEESSSVVLASGLWAYDGFVYDRQPETPFQVEADSLAPGSNNGDQEAVPLTAQWYAFQNLFD